jgi:DNA-binding MarR family transcriptional regulator
MKCFFLWCIYATTQDHMAKDAVSPKALLPLLERVARLMRADSHKGGLNPAQWEALRYLSRCNRFSNSPMALAKYLDTTKGTISQTVKSLEKKELAVKAPRDGERRSISLTLTDKGAAALRDDPLTDFMEVLDGLGGKMRRRLAKGLEDILAAETRRRGIQEFGTCTSCRYFRGSGSEPHLCMYFEAPLSDEETRLICLAHVAR